MGFLRVGAWILGLAVLSGCASSRGAWESGVYRSAAFAFRLPETPPEWRRLDLADAALAFRDESHGASILINGRCGRKVDDVPLGALTNQLLIGTTERAPVVEETTTLDGRETLHTRLVAKLDGVPMLYDVYVLKKDGCVFDLLYVARPTDADAGTAAFERVVLGFRTVPVESP